MDDVDDLFCFEQQIVFDLVQIDTLCELVGFAKSNHWDFVLGCEVSNHARAVHSNDSAITKHVVCVEEDFVSVVHETANPID